MTIGLLLIATGKYDCFVQQLLDSVDAHFFVGWDVEIYLFTDKPQNEYRTGRLKLRTIEIKHYPFPYATLYRYKHFHQYREFLTADYLFYCDVDMRFVRAVGVEVLPHEQGLTAIQHPGYYRGGWGSPNTDIRSTAYLSPEKRKQYFCGGFNGGTRKEFLAMAETLDRNISIDEANGVMAEWHDETHLNWYMAHHHPHVLSPAYCSPENWKLPFIPKLLALDKNHSEIRA